MPRRHCTARSRRTGEHCTQPAMRGSEVCRLHGGKAPQVKAKAAVRILQADAAEAVRKLGFTPVRDWSAQLQAVAGEIIALKDMLRGEVERLNRLRYEGGSGTEQTRAELTAYQAALRDTVNVLAIIAKINIEERAVRVEERQVDLVSQALAAAMNDIGMEPAEQREAMTHVARHLRALAS